MIFCFNYSRLSINLLSSFISSVFLIFVFIISNKPYVGIDIVWNQDYLNSSEITQVIEDKEIQEKSYEEIQNTLEKWYIQIPKINLNADIKNGTSEKILDYYVGHFTETSFFDGNVGLAAHNRGYNVNYFERIKELETGDEIIYIYKGETRKYIVELTQIIKETDWSYLEDTADNRITLITCVENKPEYRRCVQAVEIKEE